MHPTAAPGRFCPICGAETDAELCPVDQVHTVLLGLAAAEQGDAAVGRVIGKRYRVERLLGEGAAGRVYAATRLSLGNEVALKLLHAGSVADQRTVRRFYREARAATRLTSQHVVRVLDFGVDDDSRAPFLVMELLRGETLEAWLRRAGPLAPTVAARALVQVARALIDATQAGIVHRDLKPANIMRVATGDDTELIKVTDFGVAKDLLAVATATLTAQGAAIGTPAYMAPEQVTGGTVDHRTDLYALGCILYEMVTGSRPFAMPGRAELLLGHLLAPPTAAPGPAPVGGVDAGAAGRSPGAAAREGPGQPAGGRARGGRRPRRGRQRTPDGATRARTAPGLGDRDERGGRAGPRVPGAAPGGVGGRAAGARAHPAEARRGAAGRAAQGERGGLALALVVVANGCSEWAGSGGARSKDCHA